MQRLEHKANITDSYQAAYAETLVSDSLQTHPK